MNALIGHKVIIYTITGNAEQRDVGVLEAVDGMWLKLRKAEAEVLFFSAYQVRLVKPFDPM